MAAASTAAAVDVSKLKLAFVPGTGSMGSKLARNHARGGAATVFVGSREASKAQAAAKSIAEAAGVDGSKVVGTTNEEAARQADVVFWCAQGSLEEREALLQPLAAALENKIVVDITNIAYLPWFTAERWGQTSSTELSRGWLGRPARWVCAYKQSFAPSLDTPGGKDKDGLPLETFVAGDDADARATVIALINTTGFRANDAGPEKFIRALELMGPPWIMTLNAASLNGPYLGSWRFR